MKRAALALVLLAGCSTAPLADLMDFFAPGKLGKGNTAPYGGVCIPQGGPVVPAGPVVVPAGTVTPPGAVPLPPPTLPVATPVSSGPKANAEPPPPAPIHQTPLSPGAEPFNPLPNTLPGRSQ